VYENEGELRVYPPVIVLAAGTDDLEIVNSSNENVEVNIPDGVFQGNNGNPPIKEKVNPGKSAKSAKAVGTAQAAVYTVTGLSSKKKAKGNSDPVIIIDT